MLAILAQPAFELGWTDGAAPVIGQCLDFEPECLGPHAPVQREIAAFDDQHLVAGREQVDQRRLPGAVSGGGIGENSLVGLKYAFQAGEAFLGNRLELRRGEVDRPAVHRPQDAVRDIGRPGILIEMVPATDRHLQSPVPFHALRLYAGRVRSASCGSVARAITQMRKRQAMSLPLRVSRFLPKLGRHDSLGRNRYYPRGPGDVTRILRKFVVKCRFREVTVTRGSMDTPRSLP